jgi:hypothetical protein
MRLNIGDAQQALGFLVEQTSHIETEVYQTVYPDIQYPQLIPVDETANEWAKSVTFFSTDKVGQADWFHHMATDMRIADVNRTKYVPGMNLSAERADAARRAYEEFIDNIALRGSVDKGWTGLINDTTVTRVDAPADGTASSRLWTAKTVDLVLRDLNLPLSGLYSASNTVEMADTILLPVAQALLLSTTRITNTTDTLLSFVQKANVYTAQTGLPLTIRAVRGLETAGAGGTARMVAYKRDPRVLKLHLPMRHRFLPVWQTGPITFDVPGIFRTGGTEIRRPGAVRYFDGI